MFERPLLSSGTQLPIPVHDRCHLYSQLYKSQVLWGPKEELYHPRNGTQALLWETSVFYDRTNMDPKYFASSKIVTTISSIH
ncbi:hypothetical protein TNIN_489701 [Trichonephila inaurata madagascariensis]|uniref:Uncharacterized protein n=1 Tax=Trichonephila inaurata madagascariensis TaxID=2747483 RepID=A0A8X6YFJ3_9ARAC|nr:hypothetical protein TNIN_489701 [Trichonephila inaurata madagascariensis]